MKTRYKRDLNQVTLVIELQKSYKADYQIRMLNENYIEGLCKVKSAELDGKSQFLYEISGMKSMQSVVSQKKLTHEELKNFLLQLQRTMETVRTFLLDGSRLILRPEYIFQKEETYFFCYLPTYQKDLGQEFHTLTEYFVSQIDYDDKEGIFMAYELHKMTMEENYSLDQVTEKLFSVSYPEEAWMTAKEKRIHQNLLMEEAEQYQGNQQKNRKLNQRWEEEDLHGNEPYGEHYQGDKKKEGKGENIFEKLRKVYGKSKWGEFSDLYEGIDEL